MADLKAKKIRDGMERNASQMLAKMSITTVNGGVRAVHGLNADGFLLNTFRTAAFGTGLAQMVLFGLVAATSAAVTQMEYRHKIENIIELYHDELADRLGKPKNKLVEKDLDILAKGDAKRGIGRNHALGEELYKIRSQRTLGVMLSMASSIAVLLAIGALVTMPYLQPVVEPLSKVMSGVPLLLAEGLVGVGIYHAIKTPLKALGHKLFHLDHETAHDRIAELTQAQDNGKAITREQVLETLHSLHPALSIETSADQITADLNQGKLKATALLFAAEERMPQGLAKAAPERGQMVCEWVDHPANYRTSRLSHVEQLQQAQAQQQQALALRNPL